MSEYYCQKCLRKASMRKRETGEDVLFCGPCDIVANILTPQLSRWFYMEQKEKHDPVNHPSHYTSHPSGVECIDITEHFNFCIGNAIKYLWRAGLKGDAVEDLKKAQWYVANEIARIEKGKK